jgi:hypothetical protein
MASQLPTDETVSLEDLTISNSYEIAALVSVLERMGLLTRQDVIDEIKKLRRV